MPYISRNSNPLVFGWHVSESALVPARKMKLVVAAGMRVPLVDLLTAGRCMLDPLVEVVGPDASKVDLGSPEDIHMGLLHMQKVDILPQV